MNVVVNEMFRLRVLPLFRMNRQGDFAERIRIALADLVGRFFGQSVEAEGVRLLGGSRPEQGKSRCQGQWERAHVSGES